MGGKKWILYVSDGSESERVVPLSTMCSLTIGRSGSSGLQLKSPGVSANHALLDWHLDHPFLTDLNSTNGTRIGTDIVSSSRGLRSGDTIYLADAKLRIVALDIFDPYPVTTPVVSVARVSDQAETPDSTEPLSNQSSVRESSTQRSWRQRSMALILGAGTLAAAILGVVNLWDRFFPEVPGPVARIESVIPIKQMPLADFAASVESRKNRLLSPTAMLTDDRSDSITHTLARVGGWSAPSTPRTHIRTTYSSLTALISTGRTTFSWTSRTSSKTFTDETAPTEVTFPAAPVRPSDTDTSTPMPSKLGEQVLNDFKARPPVGHFAKVCGQQDLAHLMTPACDAASRLMTTGAFRSAPEEAAKLAIILSEVEVTESEQGNDPLGWIVDVRLDLEGLANEPMLLTWSLEGPAVPESFKDEYLSYRVTTTRQNDAGVARIWVPDLVRLGTYNVNVTLSLESDGMIAASYKGKIDND